MHERRRQRLLALVLVARIDVAIADLLPLVDSRLRPLDQGRGPQKVAVFVLLDVEKQLGFVFVFFVVVGINGLEKALGLHANKGAGSVALELLL